jgi:hypothetical protein
VSKCCSQVYYLKFLAEPILTYINDIYFYKMIKKIFIISVCDGVESKSLLFKICLELSKETFFLCVGQYLLVNLFNLQMYTESDSPNLKLLPLNIHYSRHNNKKGYLKEEYKI